MTPQQFAERCMAPPGVRWVKWRSDWDAADCYGIVILFMRAVHGIELGSVPQTDIAAGFAGARGWVECEPLPGVTAWMAFDRAGAPQHCGVLIDSLHVLHSQGDDDRGGSVTITRLSVMRRMYPDIRFYWHEAMRC